MSHPIKECDSCVENAKSIKAEYSKDSQGLDGFHKQHVLPQSFHHHIALKYDWSLYTCSHILCAMHKLKQLARCKMHARHCLQMCGAVPRDVENSFAASRSLTQLQQQFVKLNIVCSLKSSRKVKAHNTCFFKCSEPTSHIRARNARVGSWCWSKFMMFVPMPIARQYSSTCSVPMWISIRQGSVDTTGDLYCQPVSHLPNCSTSKPFNS